MAHNRKEAAMDTKDLLMMWIGAFHQALMKRGEAPTELLCRLEDGDPREFEAFFERAYKKGRMTEDEWRFYNQKPREEDLVWGARKMAGIYHRLGLIAPLMEEGRA